MWESKCFSFGKLGHDATVRGLWLHWPMDDSWVISRPSSIIRQTAPRFCWFGECPKGTVITRMYSKFPHPFRFCMAVCLCVLSWCNHYHKKRVLLVADPRGRTLPCHFRRACLPAMICCSSCSTSLPKFPEEQIIRTSLDFVHFRHTKFGSS